MTIIEAYQLAVQHHQASRLAEAEAIYRQILAVDPTHADALHMLGLIAFQTEHYDDAKNLILESITLQPSHSAAYDNLGTVLAQMGNIAEAITAHGKALALNSKDPKAHNNLGNALVAQGCFEEAISEFRKSIAFDPQAYSTHNNLGIALFEAGFVEDAIAAFNESLALMPNYHEAWRNLGFARYVTHRVDSAIQAYRQAIAHKPDFAEAHYNLAEALLSIGKFKEGFEEYEWRWRRKDAAHARRNFSQPMWDGSVLDGQTVLLHAEQGLGDTLQFIRYSPLIANRGARVVVECQKGLQRLLSSVEGISQIVVRGDALPSFDLHCPLLSLPKILATELTQIPSQIPYLKANPQDAAHWQERLIRSLPNRTSPLKIGLVWAGGMRPNVPNAKWVDQRRSLRLSQFAPLANVPGVIFVSLQKGAPSEQAKAPPKGMILLDWTEELIDFADTAENPCNPASDL